MRTRGRGEVKRVVNCHGRRCERAREVKAQMKEKAEATEERTKEGKGRGRVGEENQTTDSVRFSSVRFGQGGRQTPNHPPRSYLSIDSVWVRVRVANPVPPRTWSGSPLTPPPTNPHNLHLHHFAPKTSAPSPIPLRRMRTDIDKRARATAILRRGSGEGRRSGGRSGGIGCRRPYLGPGLNSTSEYVKKSFNRILRIDPGL